MGHDSGGAAKTASPYNRRPSARCLRWFWLGMMVGLGVMFLLDAPVLAWVRPLHESRFSDLVNHTIRQLGTGQVQAVVLLALVVVGLTAKPARSGARHLRAAGGWGILSLVVAAAAATILKVVVHRPRPWFVPPELTSWKAYLLLAIQEGKLRAFPSGESATTFAVAWTLAWCYPRLRWPLLGVAVTIAAARVVVGAHHPSDVWAGAMLGMAVAEWVTGLARRRAEQGVTPPS